MYMAKTNSNKSTNINETESKFVDYLIWLYRKRVNRKSIQTTKLRNNISAEVCLDKTTSGICWLYLMQNMVFRKKLDQYNSDKDSDQRDNIASELYYQFGVRDPAEADGFIYRGLIGKPKPVVALNKSFFEEGSDSINPFSLLKQQSIGRPKNRIYLAIEVSHSLDELMQEIKVILHEHINTGLKDDVGSKSFNLDNMFLQIISFYFSGAKKRNEIAMRVFGYKEKIDAKGNRIDKYQPVQFRSARKQFVRIAERAPFIFFR